MPPLAGESNNRDEIRTNNEYKFFKNNWYSQLSGVVAQKCFNMCQFLNKSDDAFGSKWQNHVFNMMPSRPRDDRVGRALWEDFARDQARKAVNRKRQNIGTVMKKKFNGRWFLLFTR